jgi:hypothetical protein
MKKAIVTAAVLEVQCPHCREAITEPNSGSFLWDANEKFPATLRCSGCDMEFDVVIPKTVRVG